MKRKFQIIGLLFTCFALVAQLALSLQNRTLSIVETLIRYFSYFTILTNLLVALFFTAAISRKEKSMLTLFRSEQAMLAITGYICIVAIVYHLVLSALWQPTGINLLVDQLLHTAIPLFMLLYWLATADATALRIKAVLSWLTYPILYLCFTLIRGSYVHFYPYPFLDVSQFGLAKVLVNIAYITIGTLIVLLLLFVIAKFIRPLFLITKALDKRK